MLWQGWGAADDANPFFVANLVFWIFPFLDPPGSTAASDLIGGLWYIRACLWFVLLTPLMRAGMRRSAIVAMLVPLAVVGLDAWLSWGLSESSGTGPALMDFCTYATCWMFGMAHRDGSLKRVDKVLVGVLAVAALVGGALWTRLYVPSLEIDEVPLAAALLSAGVVIPLLSASPGMAWLDKIPVLRGLLGLITGRALTIYLLFPIAVAAVPLVVARWGLGTDTRTLVLVTVGLTVLGVLLFGWVEDLAARRPLGVYPRYRRKKRKTKSFETRAVPMVAPLPDPAPVPQQPGPRQPVLQGAGPAPAVQASGPHRAVGGWSGGSSIPQEVGPGRGQPERPQSWPPQAPPHRTGPGPQHPGPLVPPNGSPAHPGPRPAQPHAGPPHPGLHHSGPQPPLHPGPQPPRAPRSGPPPNGGPPRPGVHHSGEHPQAGPPQFGPPPSGPRPPLPNGGPPRPGQQHPDPHQPGGPPPQRPQPPPPPPPAQRSGRPR
jgi:acyltransferase-like protein